MIRSFLLSVLTTCIIALATSASAHNDIFLTNLGTKTGIGAADVDDGAFDLTTRVFEGVLVFNGAAPDYYRDEPGFFALGSAAPPSLFPSGASAFAGNAPVILSFNTFAVSGNTGSLFYWDGSGGVNFQPVTGLSMSLDPSGTTTSGTGSLDFHADFELDDPMGVPADGVYLASITAKVGDLDPSDSIYMVWLANSTITSDLIAEETLELIEEGLAYPYFEEAVDWVGSNVAVPEPGSVSLLFVAVAGAAAVVRRRM